MRQQQRMRQQRKYAQTTTNKQALAKEARSVHHAWNEVLFHACIFSLR